MYVWGHVCAKVGSHGLLVLDLAGQAVVCKALIGHGPEQEIIMKVAGERYGYTNANLTTQEWLS